MREAGDVKNARGRMQEAGESVSGLEDAEAGGGGGGSAACKMKGEGRIEEARRVNMREEECARVQR